MIVLPLVPRSITATDGGDRDQDQCSSVLVVPRLPSPHRYQQRLTTRAVGKPALESNIRVKQQSSCRHSTADNNKCPTGQTCRSSFRFFHRWGGKKIPNSSSRCISSKTVRSISDELLPSFPHEHISTIHCCLKTSLPSGATTLACRTPST